MRGPRLNSTMGMSTAGPWEGSRDAGRGCAAGPTKAPARAALYHQSGPSR